jgi:hypothetical protein
VYNLLNIIANELIAAAQPAQEFGGCGFFAKETYNLFKSLGYHPKLIMKNSIIDDEYQYRKALKIAMRDLDYEDDRLPPDHIVVECENRLFDSRGVFINQPGGFEISEDELDFLLECEGWAECYDRADNVQLAINFINIKQSISALNEAQLGFSK